MRQPRGGRKLHWSHIVATSPRPHVPYYHHTWVNRSTPAVMVTPDEYEAFKRWKAEYNQ